MNIWVVNDNGTPGSPLSIECLQGKMPPKLGRRKNTCKVTPMADRNEEIAPGGEVPFFIDRTPSRQLNKCVQAERFVNQNDSITILNSPSITSVNVESVNKAELPHRHLSVDTVDLCSDNDDEHATVVNARKRKKNVKNNDTKRRRSEQRCDDVNQPDVIVLDDEDDATSKVCDSSVCIIEESVDAKSSLKPLQDSNSAFPSISAEFLFQNRNKNAVGKSSKNTSKNPFSCPQPSACNGVSARAGPSARKKTRALTRALESRVREQFRSSSVPLKPKTPGVTPCPSNSSGGSLPMDSVGSNVFIPYGRMEQTGLRPIIIDGCNVAIGHGGGRQFSVKGLCICVEYFLRRGHTTVMALVPLHRRCEVSLRDRDVLESLLKDNHLVYTPSRYIDNRLISSYDDRFIVQYAAAVGGVIVSRDNYRDLLSENPAWRDTITNRLLIPTWVGDVLMFPVDPMGKQGPTLDDFLKFPN